MVWDGGGGGVRGVRGEGGGGGVEGGVLRFVRRAALIL